MIRKPQISLFSFASALSRVMDLMDPLVVDHHMRTAYVAVAIAREMGSPLESLQRLALAGALHDVGAFQFEQRLKLLEFETSHPFQHAKAGYLLLRTFPAFEDIAEIVRFHHARWDHGQGAEVEGQPVPVEAHILHLADRVAVLMKSPDTVLAQSREILAAIDRAKGKDFVPEQVDALIRLGQREYFWLEGVSHNVGRVLEQQLPPLWLELDMKSLTEFARLLCRMIDFKSPFTATHSSGVAAAAEVLARLAGFSANEREMMRIAAYIHDLGKLAIPAELLDKPSPLSEEERRIMLAHVYYTYDIIGRIEGLESLNEWCSLHQERLDGSGYPFHYTSDELPLGARVLAVADVFTALMEDRPYRAGMDRDDALAQIHAMVDRGELDEPLVQRLEDNFESINTARADEQAAASQEYQAFVDSLV